MRCFRLLLAPRSLVLATLLGGSCTVLSSPQSRLEFRASPSVHEVEAWGTSADRLTVTVRNRGRSPVTLVRPSDGSESGWRPPWVGWSILPDRRKQQESHPSKAVPLNTSPRCGLYSSLSMADLFVLKPGETADLGSWVGLPGSSLRYPGEYRARFYYQIVPVPRDRRSSGFGGKPVDHAAWDRLAIEAPHDLFISNEIRVVVRPESEDAREARESIALRVRRLIEEARQRSESLDSTGP